MRVKITVGLAAVALLAGTSTAEAKAKYCGDVARGAVTAHDVTTSGSSCKHARIVTARFIARSRKVRIDRRIRKGGHTHRCSWKKQSCIYGGGGYPVRVIRWTWEVPYNSSLASWYDDSGNTASGSHYTYGVAHKEYAFGTQVEICFRGCVVATVSDRGPFIGGREWDLNQNVRAAIGFDGVQTVRWRLIR